MLKINDNFKIQKYNKVIFHYVTNIKYYPFEPIVTEKLYFIKRHYKKYGNTNKQESKQLITFFIMFQNERYTFLGFKAHPFNYEKVFYLH